MLQQGRHEPPACWARSVITALAAASTSSGNFSRTSRQKLSAANRPFRKRRCPGQSCGRAASNPKAAAQTEGDDLRLRHQAQRKQNCDHA